MSSNGESSRSAVCSSRGLVEGLKIRIRSKHTIHVTNKRMFGVHFILFHTDICINPKLFK